MIILRHSIVHRDLHIERARNDIGLQQHRQHQRLRHRQPGTSRPDQDVPQPCPRPFGGFRKCLGRRQLQGYAGKVLADLGIGIMPRASGGILDIDAMPGYASQDNEVIHVPMQDRRRLQLPQMLDAQTQRPRREIQFRGHRHDVAQGCAANGYRMPPPQCGQIHVPSMISGDHREARQSALGGFGLADIRDPRTAPGIDRQMMGHAVVSTWGFRLHPAACTQQRVEQPLDQAAAIEDDVGP